MVSSDDNHADSRPHPRPGRPTLGGIQFWADLAWLRGYRIQQSVFTGRCRLLNPDNRRMAIGSLTDCEASLARLGQTANLQPDTGHAIIYLHGITRSSRSLRPIIRAMPKEVYIHVPFEYPSTRVSLEQSAGYLHSVISSLTHVSKISFVVHSMGGLVVRRYLKDHQDDRLHRMVMIATPNQGAEMATMLKQNFLFRAILGPAGQELATDAAISLSSLPIPHFEFAIIAGGKGDGRGFNPLLSGDDDGTITVASTQLPGARDFLRVPRMHTFLLQDSTVIAAVRNFLEHGHFTSQ